MKNKHRKILGMMAIGAFLSPLSVLTSCSDWNDHYENASGGSSASSLYEEIASHEELSDFAVLLANTKVFRHHKVTETSYADILSGGQSLTLMAPVNGTFNLDSLLTVLETAQGDSAVEHFVVKNHIIRSPHSATEGRFKSLNGKYVVITPGTIGDVEINRSNIQTRNGVLHIMKSPIEYKKTIYETLVLDDECKDVGAGIASYNEDEFDENASISSGTIDGVPIYVDSVIYERNKMMEAIGLLNAEDSVYSVTVPTNEGWKKAWDKANKYFNYADNVDKRDSLQKYYTMRALLDDAVFSMRMQASPVDSITSVHYNRSTPEYHVFYKPYESAGLLGKAKSTKRCSNGVLYLYDEWPFEPTQTYFKKIEQEGEYTWNMTDYSTGDTLKISTKTIVGAGLHKGSYVRFAPGASKYGSLWHAIYKIPGVLSGKYKVHFVTLSKAIDPTTTDPERPVKFKATINYYDQSGKSQKFDCGALTVGTDEYDETTKANDKVIAEIDFPVCQYGQTTDVTITINGNANPKKTSTESSIIYLDYIYLEPVIE
jgi:hypothetical protein